jgi:hypothetical protein
MKGYCRASEDDSSIAVRFEQVGDAAKFAVFLQIFRDRFNEAKWDPERRAWLVSRARRHDLKRFCQAVLGPDSLLVTRDTSSDRVYRQGDRGGTGKAKLEGETLWQWVRRHDS